MRDVRYVQQQIVHPCCDCFVLTLNSAYFVSESPTFCLCRLGLLDVSITAKLSHFSRKLVDFCSSLVSTRRNLSQLLVEFKKFSDLTVAGDVTPTRKCRTRFISVFSELPNVNHGAEATA
jgi:hypothetical protein